MNQVIISTMLLFLAASVHAEDLKPYDRLSKENVTVRAKQISGGASTVHNWESGYGSYDRDKTGKNTIEVDVSSIGNKKGPLTLEFVFVAKEFGGQGQEELISERVELPTGAGKITFSASASHNDRNYVYLGERIREGKRLVGWFCRAIRESSVIGVYGSSEKYTEYAAVP